MTFCSLSFRKLSEEEYEALFEARFQEALAITHQGAEPTALEATPSASADPSATTSPPVDSESEVVAPSTAHSPSAGTVPTQAPPHAVCYDGCKVQSRGRS